jgi:hypothetical protein
MRFIFPAFPNFEVIPICGRSDAKLGQFFSGSQQPRFSGQNLDFSLPFSAGKAASAGSISVDNKKVGH